MNLLGRRNFHFTLVLPLISPTRSLSTTTPRTMPTPTKNTEKKSAQSAAKFWDKMAPSYSKQPIGDEASYQKKLQITRGYLRPDMEVLEYGCGTGGTSLIHAPYVKHILATDISQQMIGIAKTKAEEAKVTNVDFKQASIEELCTSISSNSLDAVLGLSILHLVPNRQEVIKQTYQWLKPGGLFITSTICINDMGGVVRPLMKVAAPIGRFFGFFPPQFVLATFSKDELTKEFRDAGFDIEHEWRPEDKKTGKPKKDAAAFIIGKKPA